MTILAHDIHRNLGDSCPPLTRHQGGLFTHRRASAHYWRRYPSIFYTAIKHSMLSGSYKEEAKQLTKGVHNIDEL